MVVVIGPVHRSLKLLVGVIEKKRGGRLVVSDVGILPNFGEF